MSPAQHVMKVEVKAADLPDVKRALTEAASEIDRCHRLIRLLAQTWGPGWVDEEIEAFEPCFLREPIASELRELLAVVVPETFGDRGADG